jgi:chromosome segregation protein
MRVESAELEKSLQDMHELRFQTSTALQQHDERVAIHTERVSQSRARVADDEAEISRARTRLESVGAELEIDRGNAAARREAAHASRTLLADRESALRESNGALESARDALRKHKQLALDLVREQAREKGALEQIEVTLADLTRRQDAVESQLDDLSGEETRRVADLRSIEERVAVQQATLASKQEGLARLIHRLEQTSEELMECDRAISDSSVEIAKLTDKHDFLRRIHDEHTRTADELRSHGALAGVLSDLVRVEKKYRKCFEACLAPILKSVVAGSRRDAVNWLRSYRGGEAGSVQILFPDQFVSGGARAAGDQIIGLASELIDCDPQVSTYLIAYLEGVVVVADVEAALSVIEKGLAARVATLDGVFFDGPGRVLVAGSEDIDSTMLEMRSKLDELNRSIVSAAALEKDAHQKRDAIMAARERMQDEMVSLRTALVADEKMLEGVMESRRDAELHLIRVKEKITALETAIAETRDTMLVLKPKLESSRRTAEMPDAAAGLDSADLSALEEKAIAAERERERLLEEVNSMRLEQLSAANEAETAETRVRNAETLVQELNDLVRAREEDLKRAEEQIRLSTEDMAATREAVAKLHAEKREVEARIEHANERYTAAKTKRDEVEAEIHAMKDQREIKRANIERVNVEMAGVETRIAGVVEKAREKFGRDMEPMITDRSQLDPAEWENFNREALEEMRKKLEEFGPVNMLAVAEHDEKKERFDFLTRQKQDLEEARESLTQAIRRINKEARRILAETFEQVRTNFKNTFMTLFDGGEADIFFVDSDDPLEANIKIVASPKGKKLHDISSLSSGERSLVALSLLFAIYLIKPSPFCVFDEVDAPLDDANIARFVKLLRSFTDHTQFICITHNKKTMEAADNIYGVTMEEPGVSRLISVHLDDAERFKAHGSSNRPAPQRDQASA